MASSLVGAGSLQGVIDLAIDAYLQVLRTDSEFAHAVAAARRRRRQ